MSDNDLVDRLREAGHEEQADAVRDAELAKTLRDAGHDRLADDLEGTGPPPQPQTPAEVAAAAIAAAQAHRQQAGQDFADELRRKSDEAWTSTSGL